MFKAVINSISLRLVFKIMCVVFTQKNMSRIKKANHKSNNCYICVHKVTTNLQIVTFVFFLNIFEDIFLSHISTYNKL